MKTYRYYEVVAEIDGQTETLFGSYDKSDCEYELDACKEDWQEEGYKKIKTAMRKTTEKPDPSVYPELNL